MNSKISVAGLCYSYGDGEVLHDVALSVNKGELVGLIGPNGSGKSTTLKCIYGALRPQGGRVLLDGADTASMSHRALAENLAVVGQEMETVFDFPVREVVAMGRNPHKRLFEPDTEQDSEIIGAALAHMGMEALAQCGFRQLSGGEKQRVLIARAIAQQTDFLILDEPTNHLDIRYQLQVFEKVRALGVTTLAAIHDMNLAALFCDRIYVLEAGRNYADGTPEDILTETLVGKVFGVRARILKQETDGKPHAVFIPDLTAVGVKIP